MSNLKINPNAPPVLTDNEDEWLDRDRAALGMTSGEQAPLHVIAREGLTPLGPLMVTPDPRYRHGDIEAIEAQTPSARTPGPDAADPAPPAGARKATDHPLIATLVSTLPAPGAAWPLEEREIWLKAAASIFDMTYTTEDHGDDEAPEAS